MDTGDTSAYFDGAMCVEGESAFAFSDKPTSYLEGTYTATLTCGTSGTITLNSSYNTLAYVKIGRMVYVQGYLAMSAISSPLGTLKLNIPFPSTALSQYADSSFGTIIYSGINAIGSAGSLAIMMLNKATAASIIERTTTDYLDDVANHIKASTGLGVSFSYIAT